ncbi:MAG TPA: hypothetical protein VJM33_13580 [Microthrixaceae bacterium]|nr:hypothetical protein [Microthrixaceae bacterium]
MRAIEGIDALGAAERDVVAIGLAASVRDSVARLDVAVERRWWRLVETDEFDAWLIDWPIDARVPRHDHDGAAASIAVVRGRLVELRFTGTTRTGTSILVPGRAHRVAADASHEIVNREAVPATSVHVYSPPLRSMAFYDTAGVRTHRDVVDAAPALWSLDLT